MFFFSVCILEREFILLKIFKQLYVGRLTFSRNAIWLCGVMMRSGWVQ